jgi:hypothetical protein
MPDSFWGVMLIGLTAAAAYINFVRILPLPGFVKTIFGILFPIVVIPMGLLVVFYGPGPDLCLGKNRGGSAKAFLVGAAVWIGGELLWALIRRFREKGADEDAEDAE